MMAIVFTCCTSFIFGLLQADSRGGSARLSLGYDTSGCSLNIATLMFETFQFVVQDLWFQEWQALDFMRQFKVLNWDGLVQ